MKTFFGLPKDVRFCRLCVLSNQRPNTTVEFKHNKNRSGANYTGFSSDCVCNACQVNLEKDKINWENRQNELHKLLDRYRGKKKPYDCVVPGSGGKDSFYTAHLLKEKYGMSPLLVTWQPISYTEYGKKAYSNWVEKIAADGLTFRPNPDVMRRLTALGFRNLLHPFQTFIIGQKNFAPKVALERGIELIFYGESPAEYGNGLDEFRKSQMDPSYYSLNSYSGVKLGGVPLNQLVKDHDFTEADLMPFLPIKTSELNGRRLKYFYLSHFHRWDPQESYYVAAKSGEFHPRPYKSEGTYTRYASFDDKIDDLHYFTTHVKFGIGRATYDASQEIRNGHIDRVDGVSLVKQFDGEFPKRYFDEILESLNLTSAEFIEICNEFRSPHLWDTSDRENPKLRFSVWKE